MNPWHLILTAAAGAGLYYAARKSAARTGGGAPIFPGRPSDDDDDRPEPFAPAFFPNLVACTDYKGRQICVWRSNYHRDEFADFTATIDNEDSGVEAVHYASEKYAVPTLLDATKARIDFLISEFGGD